jgi:hypothetical protein
VIREQGNDNRAVLSSSHTFGQEESNGVSEELDGATEEEEEEDTGEIL